MERLHLQSFLSQEDQGLTGFQTLWKIPMFSLVQPVWRGYRIKIGWEGEAHLKTLNTLPYLCLGAFVYLNRAWTTEVGP